MGVTGSFYNMSHKSFSNIALGQRLPITFSDAFIVEKPTAVTIGANSGFSMPIYNSDNEELFFTTAIPRRWDGTTDPIITIYAHLGNTEDVGDKFKLQLSYTCNGSTGAISATTNDIPIETTVITDRAAQYDTYAISFTIDHTKLSALCEFKARLRRIAASVNEVSNEIIITSAYINFKRDKTGVVWS